MTPARQMIPAGARFALAQVALGTPPRDIAMQLIRRNREDDLHFLLRASNPYFVALRRVVYHAKLRTYKYRPPKLPARLRAQA